LNRERRIYGADHVIIVLDRDIKKGHGRIAQQAINDAIMLNDDSGGGLKKFFRDRRQRFNPQLMR
jgi:hypothetical protein